MDMKDLVEILCQYDIKKCPINFIDTNMRLYGICCAESKQIILESRQPINEMRDSIIHECYHAHHYIKGDMYGVPIKEQEKIVRRETKELMRELYGKK